MAYYSNSNLKPPGGFMTPNLSPEQSGQAAFQGSQQQPDLLQNFLAQLTRLLGEGEEPETPPAPGPATMEENFNLAALAPYAPQEVFKANLQRAQATRMAQTGGAAARNKARRARIDDLQAAANLASLMPQREANTALAAGRLNKLGQPIQSITRGNVRTDIGVDDPNSPTGVSDVDYQLVPMPDGSVQFREIARRHQAVRQQSGFGAMGGQPGRYRQNPVTGEIEFNTALTPIAPVGAVNAAVSNVESKAALDALVGAYNTARQSFGIEYANPSVLAGIRAKLSQGLSQRQWLRDVEMAGISAPKFLQFDAARKRALNSYVKAQTGAQFSVKELERYEAQFPLPWDDPETARIMLESLAQAAVGRMNSLITQYGSLQAMLAARPDEVEAGTATPSAPDFSGFVRP